MTILCSNFIVGVAGKAGHGKDTVANILKEKLEAQDQFSQIMRLADAIKDAYAVMFSIDRPKLEELDFKLKVNEVTGTTHRQELQFIGTEAYRVRTGNPDVWIKVLVHRLESWFNSSLFPVIVPDIRFENEAQFCRQNGILIRVERPGQPETINAGHISEAGFQTPPHLTILNDGTIQDLESKCDEAARLILTRYEAYETGLKDLKSQMFV